MILGIGHDAVAITRFSHWHTYSRKKLKRIFSDQEIDYCLCEPIKSAERLAARFAAKEALYKALSQTGHPMPFLTLCASIEISPSPHGPQMRFKNTALPLKISVSLTHTDQYAYAIVIIQN